MELIIAVAVGAVLAVSCILLGFNLARGESVIPEVSLPESFDGTVLDYAVYENEE